MKKIQSDARASEPKKIKNNSETIIVLGAADTFMMLVVLDRIVVVSRSYFPLLVCIFKNFR